MKNSTLSWLERVSGTAAAARPFRTGGILLLTAAVVLTISGCGRSGKKAGRSKIVRVSIAGMTERNFRQRIPVQGTVEPVDFASLSSRTEGTMDVLNVDEGDVVAKGQILFQIDRQNLENSVTVAQRELEVSQSELNTSRISLDLAKIKLNKAQTDYRRAQTLRVSNAISQESLEEAELARNEAEAEFSKSESLLQIAQARMEKQKNTLSIARKNLADSEVRAPFDGIITDKFVELGEFVKGGTPILRIENQQKLEVVCQISALHYGNIIPGKTRAVLHLDETAAGEASVTYRAPNVDPLTRTFKIKITLPRDTRLVSGLMCSVDLVTEERRGFGLPSDAVQQRDNGTHVAFFVKDGQQAEIAEVLPGITDGKCTEIRNASGFTDRKFVVRGQSFINPGDQLSILEELDPSCF